MLKLPLPEPDIPRVRLRTRLGDPRLISWPTFWISSALLIYEIFLQSLALYVISQILVFTLLFAARWTYLRRGFSRRHIWVMLTTIFFASLFGVIAAQLILATTLITVDGTFARIIVIPVAGLLSISLIDYRNTVSELSQLREQLMNTRHQGLTSIVAARTQVVDRVESTLQRTLEELADDRAETGRIDAEKLSDLVQQTIRPLSHELAQQTPDFQPAQLPPPHIRWPAVFANVAARPLLSPTWMAVAVTIMSIRFTFSDAGEVATTAEIALGPFGVSFDPDSFASSVGFLATIFVGMWFITWFAVRITTPLLQRSSPLRRWMIVLASVVGIGLGLELMLRVADALPGPVNIDDPNVWERFWTYAPIVVVSLVLAIARAVSLARKSVLDDLAQANSELTWEVARIRLDLWVQQRQLAQAVHGPLQAAITASALLLSQAQTDSPSRSPADSTSESTAVRDAHTRIYAALRGVANPHQPITTLASGIRDIRNTWAGVCDISFDISDVAEQIVDADNTCRQAAVVIIGEAVANAAIHGKASQVEVTVRTGSSGFITLEVRDNGTGVTNDNTRGLGSSILDAMCTDWEIRGSDHDNTGSVLTASLASAPTQRLSVHN